MAAPAVWIVVRDSGGRAAGGAILVLAAVVLTASSSNAVWHGARAFRGVFGRGRPRCFVAYLASVLGRVRPVARWWPLFLGLISGFSCS